MPLNLQKIQRLILILGWLTPAAEAQTSANLFHFLKNTKLNSPVLKSQEAQAAAQGYAKSRADAGWYPTLAVEGSRLHDLPLTEREMTRSSDSLQLQLGVLQPLYDEKLPRTQERESLLGKRARAQVEDATERLLFETGTAFFTLAQYLAEAALKTQQLTLQLEEEAVIQRRIRLGELNLTNASQIHSQIERSRANIALLKNKIMEQKLNLYRLCLCPVPETLQLPPESVWAKALESRPNASTPLLNVSKADIEVAQADLRLIQSKTRPTLQLEGLLYRDFMDENQGVRSSLALNFVWPIDAARVTQHESSQASSLLQSARLNLQAQQSDLLSNQQIARERLRVLLDSRRFFESALQSAREHFQHTKRQFAEGANTQSELFLAQDNLFQAESDLLGHTFESWLAYWNLIFYRDSVSRLLQETGEGG
ncbi:TolC family protein [Oligoflexus tunisiensis]|uniref:TolC family protein n=1 Tax=Oligoflexus tunisiensis TaxID=708132 RepID=UPI000AB6550B|nr:TolC family protein [Oligoflexus tunisiensis]